MSIISSQTLLSLKSQVTGPRRSQTKEDIALAERAEKLQTLQTLTQAYFACDKDSDGYICESDGSVCAVFSCQGI